MDLENLDLNSYLSNIDKYGLNSTWDNILNYLLDYKTSSKILDLNNLGELYEIGLEHTNKIEKKELGKYYTPSDVALVLSKWLLPFDDDNICDVGCGTGNLIMTYLNLLDKKDVEKLLKNKNIYLYDQDKIALKICKYLIAIKYGKEYINNINTISGDFLSNKIKLPNKCKVISNPPYFKISKIKTTWKKSEIINDSKELYSAFMEKIIKNSNHSVIITPYSFLGARKYYSLRLLLNQYNGFIVSFDNVPGNIFNGRKHGIFNSNNTNSVRAAITVVENKDSIKGFRISPLIRFKTSERKKILNNKILHNLVGEEYQIVSEKNKAYYKCFNELNEVYKSWISKSNKTLKQYITTANNNNKMICVPTTCRYFTVGSSIELSRDGKRKFYLRDNSYFDYVYAMFNSSFCYWWWRLIDGGINCSVSLINSIPVFYDSLTEQQKKQLHHIVNKMLNDEKKYLVYKRNAGKNQESIKFPKKYRDEINNIFLSALNINKKSNIFDLVHSSSFFKNNEGDEDE